jgi:hypothetical protein
LLLPDEQRFREYCKKTGMPYNKEHKHEDFSLRKVKKIVKTLGMLVIQEYNKLIYSPEQSDYNFAIIAQKE